MQNTVPSPAPGATSSVPDVQWGPSRTPRAAVKTLPAKKGSCRKISPLLLRVPGLSLCTPGGAAARFSGSVSFHQPDNHLLTASAQPLDLGAANSPGGGPRFLPRLRSPASPGAGASMRVSAWE